MHVCASCNLRALGRACSERAEYVQVGDGCLCRCGGFQEQGGELLPAPFGRMIGQDQLRRRQCLCLFRDTDQLLVTFLPSVAGWIARFESNGLQEYARCRRLNVTLSSALGDQACSSLEAEYALSPSSRHRHPHGRTNKSAAGGSVGGGWVPLPPPALLPRTSGLFRRLPLPPPLSRSTSTAATAATARVASDLRHSETGSGKANASRSPSPPLPPPLPPQSPPLPVLVSETAAAAAAGEGEGCWPRATEVKRALRFCMKVHRFREICRLGSCVSFRKVRENQIPN